MPSVNAVTFALYPYVRILTRYGSRISGSKSPGQNTSVLRLVHVSLGWPLRPCTKTILSHARSQFRACRQECLVIIYIDRVRLRGTINILDQWFLSLRAVDFSHANLLDLLGLGCARHGSLSCDQNEPLLRAALLNESTFDLKASRIYRLSEQRRSRGASDRPGMSAAWRAC